MKKKGYWWECSNCKHSISFKAATGKGSVASFVWDVLEPSGWDQSLLNKDCSECECGQLKISYDFPNNDTEIVQVNHIFGVKNKGFDYLPMIWETSPNKNISKKWYDFKYQVKRNNFGLNKPPVMQANVLNDLLRGIEKLSGETIIK